MTPLLILTLSTTVLTVVQATIGSNYYTHGEVSGILIGSLVAIIVGISFIYYLYKSNCFGLCNSLLVTNIQQEHQGNDHESAQNGDMNTVFSSPVALENESKIDL